eukprot:EG_transcript_19226
MCAEAHREQLDPLAQSHSAARELDPADSPECLSLPPAAPEPSPPAAVADGPPPPELARAPTCAPAEAHAAPAPPPKCPEPAGTPLAGQQSDSPGAPSEPTASEPAADLRAPPPLDSHSSVSPPPPLSSVGRLASDHDPHVTFQRLCLEETRVLQRLMQLQLDFSDRARRRTEQLRKLEAELSSFDGFPLAELLTAP